MKRKLFFYILFFTVFNCFSQNKITLKQNQKSLISFPEVLTQTYNLAEFEEAVCFSGNNTEEIVSGVYCIFKDFSYIKKQNNKEKKNFLSQLIYLPLDGESFTDILYLNENESYSLETDIKNKYSHEYIKFDDFGNIFINVYKKSEGTAGILMYSPEKSIKKFLWLPTEYTKIEDFAVSSDGKYIVVVGNNGNSNKSCQAFLFNTNEDFRTPENLLYIPASKITSVLYNPQNKNFYMLASFYDPNLAYDETGKICVLTYKDNKYTQQNIKYFSQREIENGKDLDFWNNLFVIDQLDNRIYTATIPGNVYPHDGKLYELVDDNNSLKLKLVEETSGILFHSADYYGTGKELISTSLGLFIKDKNLKTYFLKDQKLTEKSENEINIMLEDYNQKLFLQRRSISQDSRYKKIIKQKDSAIDELKQKTKLYSILIILLCVISIALLLLLCFITIHKRILIRKTLQKRILEIQENERSKLSRDIHDSVVQDIRAIRLQTDLIEVEQNQRAQQQKERVIEEITQTIVKMRNICYNLTPAELATHNDGDSSKIELISVLDSLSQQFYVKTKIPCSLQIDSELIYPEYDKETSLHLVRIFQELLNNIEKHSYATNVNVLVRNKIEDNQKYLVIFLIDDGIGCNIEQCLKSRKKTHFGLSNIQERIKLIDGNIEFFSSQNEGMKIKITVKM